LNAIVIDADIGVITANDNKVQFIVVPSNSSLSSYSKNNTGELNTDERDAEEVTTSSIMVKSDAHIGMQKK
jgi:methylthioribose-1-phosphate isomerase